METATAVMSCAPAWLALVAEALVDAGVRHGLDREQAGRLVAETVAGTGALLADAGVDPAELRRRVTSPGGLDRARARPRSRRRAARGVRRRRGRGGRTA